VAGRAAVNGAARRTTFLDRYGHPRADSLGMRECFLNGLVTMSTINDVHYYCKCFFVYFFRAAPIPGWSGRPPVGSFQRH